MRGLVRNHEVIRALPKTAAAAMATATLGLNLLLFERLKSGPLLGLDRTGWFEIVILDGGLLVLLMKEAGRRAAPWVQALPLDSRTLWTAHQRALVLAVSLVVLGMAVIVLGFSQLIRRMDALEFLSAYGLLVHFARPWLVLLAAALCLGTWRSAVVDPIRARNWNRWRWTVIVGAILTLVLLESLPLPVALVPVLVAFAWAVRGRSMLPPVLGFVDRPEEAVGPSAGDIPQRGRRVVNWVILRQLFKWPLTWIVGIPVTFLLGMVQGGAFSFTLDADFARYFNVWITIYMFIAFVGHFLDNLYRVDHLPISRNLLIRWLVLPNLCALLAGGLVGMAMDMNRDPGEALAFENDTSKENSGLLVPVDQWRPALGTPPESVTAPWGEERPVSSVPVIRGLPLMVWNPFTTSTEASPDFVAWQIARAVEAAHGVALDPDLIRDRYLISGSSGVVEVAESGLTLISDGLVPARGPVGPVSGLLMGFTVTASLLTTGMIFLFCGPGVSRRRIKTVFWAAMGILMAFHLGGYVLLMGHWITEWTVSALVERAAASMGNLGLAGWVATWGLGLVCALAAWRFCLRAFARVEAVSGR